MLKMKELPFTYTFPESLEKICLEVKEISFHDQGPYSFTLAGGKTLGLSGQSGIGKTQLLRAVADTIPHRGEVFLNGTLCCEIDAPRWRSMVSLVPAESAWWFDTVGLHFKNFSSGLLPQWLEYLGFSDDVFNWRISRLSTGEKQRLALLRNLEKLPKVLLLDEPSSALDNHHTQLLEGLLQQYQAQYGTAIVWISHDLEQLNRVSDMTGQVTRVSLEMDQCTLISP